MAVEDIAYISLNLSPTLGANDTVVGVRVVPAGRDGNLVYARSLNEGEPDNGERIPLEIGDKLVCPPGSIKVTLEDVDRYAEQEFDGYAPIINTVWTWLHVPPSPDEFFFNFMLTASRRLDDAHALCASALRELGHRPDEPFIKTRSRIFNAFGNAEQMCIYLSLVIELINDARTRFSLKTDVPAEVEEIASRVRAIRNAFMHPYSHVPGGHIDKEDLGDPTEILDQEELLSHGILSFAGHSLDLRKQIIPTLIATRKFIYDVISEIGTTKTYNGAIEMGPFEDG